VLDDVARLVALQPSDEVPARNSESALGEFFLYFRYLHH
jgi:hypothetical protein